MHEEGQREDTGQLREEHSELLNIELGFVKPVELQVEAEADSFKSDQRNQVDHWYGAWMKWKNGCLNNTAHSEGKPATRSLFQKAGLTTLNSGLTNHALEIRY